MKTGRICLQIARADMKMGAIVQRSPPANRMWHPALSVEKPLLSLDN